MYYVAIGQPFPMPFPSADGATFEIGPDGDMNLIIRMDGLSTREKAALQAGFERYSLFVSDVMAWVFKFPAPVGFIDAPFHAGLYSDERIEKFLSINGNTLMVYVVDRGITQHIHLHGLQWEAVEMFQEAVKKQGSISRVNYDTAIDRLFRHSSKELFSAGRMFLARAVGA